MPITYTPATDVIEITGYSEITPATLEDIYLADIAGAWGQVSKQGNDQYLIDAHLYIATDTSSGWFADEAKQLVMGSRKEIWVKAEGHVRFGELLDETEATTANSCMVLMDLTGVSDKIRIDGEFEFYGSNFLSSTRNTGMFYLSPDLDTNKIRFWNCYVSEVGYVYEYGSFGSVAKNWIRSTISNNQVGLNLTTGSFPPEHFNDTLIQGCDSGVRCTWLGYTGDETITVRNLWIKDSQDQDFNFYNWGTNGAADFYAIDAICDWVFYWSGTSMENDRAQLHRQYTFNLHVVDEDGVDVANAQVECWDKDGTLLFDVLTAANGTITEQIITHGIYRPTVSIVLESSGYVDCISSDVFKQVQDDGVEVGELVGYDNSTRTWYISTRETIAATSVMTITGGTGSGTSSTTTGVYEDYMIARGPHRVKVLKTGYNHIDYIGEIDEPIDWTLTLTHPCYPWDTDKIEADTAPGYNHANVANYPMSWNDAGNILTIWGDDGSGGKEPMGYDADNPITIEHVWAFAAYTKGTCICTKDSPPGEDAYTMKARLEIGDGIATTFFASENQSVWLYDYFKIKNNATMRMGSIATDANNPYPDPKWGATWTIDRQTNPDLSKCYFVENGGNLYVYDSRIALTDNSLAFDTEAGAYTYVGYSTFAGYDRLDATYIRWWGVLEFDHMTLHHCRNMNFPTPPHANSAVLNVYDNQNDLQVRDNESWIYDATLSNAITCACKTLFGGTANLVDTIGFDTSKVCNAQTVCWQKMWHRFAVRVKDEVGDPIVGAIVIVKNNADVEVYNETTDATGWTTMQLIKEWQTKPVIGEPLIYPDDFDLEGPFTLTVYASGRQTYTEGLDITNRMDDKEVTLYLETINVDTENVS